MHDCIVIFHRCALLDVAKGLFSTVSEHTYFNCKSELHTVVPCQVFNAIYINKCQFICQGAENVWIVQFKQATWHNRVFFFICWYCASSCVFSKCQIVWRSRCTVCKWKIPHQIGWTCASSGHLLVHTCNCTHCNERASLHCEWAHAHSG